MTRKTCYLTRTLYILHRDKMAKLTNEIPKHLRNDLLKALLNGKADKVIKLINSVYKQAMTAGYDLGTETGTSNAFYDAYERGKEEGFEAGLDDCEKHTRRY